MSKKITNMGLTEAVNIGTFKDITRAVKAAVSLYKAELPAEPEICTVWANKTPFSVLDADSKRQILEMEVQSLTMQVSKMDAKSATYEIDIAMLIAKNAYFRHAGRTVDGAGLL